MEDRKTTDYSPLLEGVLTVSDRDVFLGQLGELEEQMFKQPVSEVLESVFPYERKAAFVNLLHEEKIDPSAHSASSPQQGSGQAGQAGSGPSDPSNLVKIQDVIKDVREYLSSIPVLSVTLVEAPREALLKKIALAVSDQTQQPLFIDISIDSSILGGSKLEWGGKVEDYSLEKRLEEYFKVTSAK